MRDLVRRELRSIRQAKSQTETASATATTPEAKSFAERLSHQEFIARYRRDFEAFLGLLEIIPQPDGETEAMPRPLLPLKSTQRQFLDTCTGRDIVLKARKVGMTTLT